MTPIAIAGLLLELLKGFQAAGKTPDQQATQAELDAAGAKAQTSLDALQAAIDAKKKP